jgi:hypothetical protein
VWAVGSGGPARESSVEKSGSTSRLRATCLEPWFGRRRSGKWGSTARSSGGANSAVVVVLGSVWAGARCSLFIGTRGEEGLGVSGPARARCRRRVGHGWIRAGKGDLVAGRSVLVGSRPLARIAGRHRQPGGQRPLPLDGTEQGRGEKREGEREESGFKLNFYKILSRNLKNFKYKSCREFENLQLLF